MKHYRIEVDVRVKDNSVYDLYKRICLLAEDSMCEIKTSLFQPPSDVPISVHAHYPGAVGVKS